MIKKFLSYFTPIVVKRITSDTKQELIVKYIAGELILDTKNTNYSYGKLDHVLRKGLQFIGYEKIKQKKQVLILGLGAGNIIKLLREEVKYTAEIDSVEIDPAIVNLGRKYFNLEEYNNKHQIHLTDAFEFVLRCKKEYGLVVIDIFNDYRMPDFLFEAYFINHLSHIVAPGGFIIFNTIALTEEQKKRNKRFCSLFNEALFSTRTYPKELNFNEIITVKRLL